MAVYSLAECLGKRIHEILDMSFEEFAGWIAYFKIQNQRYKSKQQMRKK